MRQVPTNAYEQLAASIRSAIDAGMLKDGERLPPEVILARESGVSRSTVREALRVLQEAGAIERVSPKILVVRTEAAGQVHRAIDGVLRGRTITFAALHEALLLLEPELSRLAAMRSNASDVQQLADILQSQHAHSRDFDEWCRLDEKFHLAIAGASANAPLILTRAALGRLLLPVVAQLVTTELATQTATAFHERLLEEIANGDGELAAVVTRRHVNDFRAAWERSGRSYNRDISNVIDPATGRLDGAGHAPYLHYNDCVTRVSS